jgi:hypothetical protein
MAEPAVHECPELVPLSAASDDFFIHFIPIQNLDLQRFVFNEHIVPSRRDEDFLLENRFGLELDLKTVCAPALTCVRTVLEAKP